MSNLKKGRMDLTINSEIREILASKGIPIHDGMSVLIDLYYNITPSYIPEILVNKVLSAGIINVDYENEEIVWLVSLFEETITGFEWISEWMDMFKQVNPTRRGARAEVLKRMKKFFKNNPAISKKEVMQSTKNYLDSLTDPKYCKMSQRFIYEQDGSSMLSDYVEQLELAEKMKDMYKEDII